jgi:lipopolysaccharide/colanic/teichoic acid biosynthesis glycosyltransferase
MRVEGQPLEVAVPSYTLSQLAQPGITGWAQINGSRGEIVTIEQLRRRVQLDIEYVTQWSHFLDLRILSMTAYKVFAVRNAY